MEEYEVQRSPETGTAQPASNTGPAETFVGRPVAAPPRATTPLPALPATAAPHRKGRQPAGRPLIVFTLLAGLVAGSLGGGATAWTLSQANTAHTVVASAPAVALQPVANTGASAITSLYNQVTNSVVDIQTTVGSSNSRFSGSGEGSGIVVDSSHVLTNYHVVQGANTVRIVLQDGTSVTATVTGSDQTDDLALLSANLPAGKVKAATLGDSDQVQVGEEVVAIGSPFGLQHTVTAGIVSAVNRQWSANNGPEQAMIQTDAPINPGNSGGPLFNLQGEVIGIDTAIESPVDGSVGVGFAIPINRAKTLLPQLSQGATVQRAWLGISGATLTSDLAAQYNTAVSQGVVVAAVTAGSPAAQAGLQGADPTTSTTLGDIITAVDGNATSTVEALTSYLANKHVGDTVTLTIVRNGQRQQVKATLAAWPAQQSPSSNGSNQSPFGGNGQTPNGANQSPFGGNTLP